MSSPKHLPRAGRPSPAAARALRDRAQRAVRSSSPPTTIIAVSAGGDAIDERKGRAVIDLALRMGESMLSTGASASDVTATVLRMVDAYGLRSCHVDIAFTSITVSYHRGVEHDPMTVMRIVKVRTADYTRLEKLHDLVREITKGLLAVDEARSRLDEVIRAPHPYRRWLVTGSLAALAAGVAALFGAGVIMMLISAVATALIDRTQRWLAHRGISAFFSQAVGAAIPTVFAVLLYALQSHGVSVPSGLSPSLVVVSGIVVLLSGMSVVGAAQDAIDGYYLTAAARTFEVVTLTVGIVVGITVTLAAAQHAGVTMHLSTSAPLSGNRVVLLVASIVIAAAFSLSAYTGLRATGVAAGVGGMAWLLYSFAVDLHLGMPSASAVAALAIGVLSQVLSRQLRIPALALSSAGIIPLVPGFTVYRGLFELVQRPDSLGTGLSTLLSAAGIGLGLAAGVSMGTFLARPILHELDRGQQRALQRARADARE
ncbi:threonine/serine ThrE exporter family protein [Segeticoccus rhizosphaerae]|uniref:threonine/serine ThrE exporter family protein n=1 Tax=Segeticoccus rhizosphaerae TaxID=1104777 RepID=UPI0010C00034|nr:threonine/serine exporter family protein [Ornithinicoccus soli]